FLSALPPKIRALSDLSLAGTVPSLHPVPGTGICGVIFAGTAPSLWHPLRPPSREPQCPLPVRRNVEMGLSAGIGKSTQHESVGIALDVIWLEPMTNSSEDIAATQRAQDFQFRWFIDPLVFGDYPISMRTRVKNRLPRFTAFKDLRPIGDRLYIVPRGMRSLMNYIKQKYSNPPVFIAEKARMDDPNGPFIFINDALKDDKRIMREVAKSESFKCYITFGKLFFMKHYKVPFSSKYV
ncbi:Beta-glucosidase 6, partial [Ananas comosus]